MGDLALTVWDKLRCAERRIAKLEAALADERERAECAEKALNDWRVEARARLDLWENDLKRAIAAESRLAIIRRAHERWHKERGGIALACFEATYQQERSFAKADHDFALAVEHALKESAE